MIIFYIFLFLISCVILYFSGELVIGALMRVARYLRWREFVVSFFVMAFAASFPNLFVGIISALKGIPQLSLGDVSGNNLIAMTLAVALAVFFTKDGIPAESRTVQFTSNFTFLAALLPIFLILDKNLSRIDGCILIGFFIYYMVWLFSKKERFVRLYEEHKPTEGLIKQFGAFLKDALKVMVGIILLLFASQGIVSSAQVLAQTFNLSLVFVGLIIVGFGNALPEIYFAVASAKRKETWMILGNLMGSVIVPATLVLGIVALIRPIEITDFSPFVVARFFLVLAAIFFLFCVKSGQKITKKEALVLLLIYLVFVFLQFLIK